MTAVRVHVESLHNPGLPHSDRLIVLRGQLTLLRRRCEEKLPVSLDSHRRAELLARGLEAEDLAP